MPLKDIEISEETLIYKFQEQSDKYKIDCQIDSIAWSANGRYAIVALSVRKLIDEQDKEQREEKEKNN